MSRPGRLCLALLVAAVVVVGSGVALPDPAAGQRIDPRPLDVRLIEVEGIVDDNDNASLRAAIEVRTGPVRRHDLRLVTTVFTRVTDAAALRAAPVGDAQSVFSATSTALPDLAPGTTRVLRTSASTRDLALQGPGLAGVYPVQLQVFEGPDPVGAVMTSMIVLPDTRPAPLFAASVISLRSQAEPLRGDLPAPSLERLLNPDSDLMAFVDTVDAVVADGSAAGVTLAADGRLLDDLQRLSNGFLRADRSALNPGSRRARRAQTAITAVRQLARRGDTEVLAYPYGPADLVALVHNDLDGEALRQVRAGVAALTRMTGRPVSDDIIVPPDGLDAATVAALGPMAADAVLLGERYVAFAAGEGLEPVRRLRTADGGEVRVLVPDARLSTLLSDADEQSSVEAVQQLLAETALQWLNREPGRAGSTALFLHFEALTSGDPARVGSATDNDNTIALEVIAATTQAIAQAPWLRPVALSTLLTNVDPSDRLVQLSYPARSGAAELGPDYLAQLQRARDALGPLSRMLPADDPMPTSFAEPLEAMSSVAYREQTAAPAGAERADQVLDRLQELTDAVQILPSAPVTLTSATGEVPVTVTNTSDVTLEVQATASASRFAFTDSTQTITLAPQSTQRLIFEAQALNPGGFAPLLVTLSDPTGSWELAAQQLSVRSTAIPIVGVVATLGSVMVLLFWGIKQGRRRPGRHERRRDTASAA